MNDNLGGLLTQWIDLVNLQSLSTMNVFGHTNYPICNLESYIYSTRSVLYTLKYLTCHSFVANYFCFHVIRLESILHTSCKLRCKQNSGGSLLWFRNIFQGDVSVWPSLDCYELLWGLLQILRTAGFFAFFPGCQIYEGSGNGWVGTKISQLHEPWEFKTVTSGGNNISCNKELENGTLLESVFSSELLYLYTFFPMKVQRDGSVILKLERTSYPGAISKCVIATGWMQ